MPPLKIGTPMFGQVSKFPRTGTTLPRTDWIASKEIFQQTIIKAAREQMKLRKQWLTAVICSGYVLNKKPRMRSNIRFRPAADPRSMRSIQLVNKTYKGLQNRLKAEDWAFLERKAMILVLPSATPRTVDEALGPYGDLDPVKLMHECPFKIAREAVAVNDAAGWLGPQSNPNFYSPKYLDVTLDYAHCHSTEDWFGDEPYFAVQYASLKASVIDDLIKNTKSDSATLTKAFTITPANYDIGGFTTTPGSNIDEGGDYQVNKPLITQLPFTQGLVVWNTSMMLMEEDLAESKEMQEKLGDAADIVSGAAQVFDVVAGVGAEFPLISAVSEVIALGCRITAQILNVAVTLMQIFKDNDDYLGTAKLYDSEIYVMRAEPDPTFDVSDQTALQFEGDGALYTGYLTKRYSGVTKLTSKFFVNQAPLPKSRYEEKQIGDNDVFTGDKRDDRQGFTFYGGHWTKAEVSVTPLDGYDDQARLVDGTVSLTQLNKGDVIKFFGFKMTIPDDCTLVSFVVHAWYNPIIIGGTGEARWGQSVTVSN